MNLDEGIGKLEYSHTDCIVELENEARAMVEIIQFLLREGSYIVRTMPTDVSFDFKLTKADKCMNYLKKMIFMSNPDIETKDIYLNEDLCVNDLEHYSRSIES